MVVTDADFPFLTICVFLQIAIISVASFSEHSLLKWGIFEQRAGHVQSSPDLEHGRRLHGRDRKNLTRIATTETARFSESVISQLTHQWYYYLFSKGILGYSHLKLKYRAIAVNLTYAE